MSQTVDSKVVEMQFDNAQFEKNVQTSLSTLDRLKNALNFGDSVKSLGSLGAAAGHISMGGIIGAVDTVSTKFSALEVIGVTALANITTQAVRAGEKLVSSLSIDNITAGFSKFGEKTQSVATLVAQGYELEKVNEQLNKLNWFTDETSYNFTDMTSNIAKFTASGQDLESSVTAMQGIANWAALSGQNAMTASRAMYQLSQAMGAGIMRKEDYRSIQNASMDTQEFRQHALDAAVALGTLQKNADGTYRSIVEGASQEDFAIGQFADHLTKDMWFTSDVMMQVFQDYSSAVQPIYDFTDTYGLLASEVLEAKHKYDESGEAFKEYIETLDLSKAGQKDLEELVKNLDDFGVKALEAAQQARTWEDVVDSVKDAVSTAWMNTFEIIFGTQEEATKLFTAMSNELYDVFAEPINGLNELLEEGLGEDSVKFASEAFQQANAELDDFTGRGVLIDAFGKIWKNLLDTIDILPEAFRQVFPETTAEGLYNAIVAFHDFAEGLRLSDEAADLLSRTLYGIFSAFDIVKTVVGTIAGAVFPELLEGFSGLATRLFGSTASLGDWIGGLNESIKSSETLQAVAQRMADVVHKAFEFIFSILDSVGPMLSNFIGFARENFITPGFEAFSKLLETIQNHMTGASDTVQSLKNTIVGVFTNIQNKLAGAGFFQSLQKIWAVLKSAARTVLESTGNAIGKIIDAIAHADFKGIMDFFASLAGTGVGVGLIGVLNQVREFIAALNEGGGQKESPIASLINSVKDTLSAMQEKLKPDRLRQIAISIAILAGSLFVLSLIESDKLESSLSAMLGLFIELMGSLYAYTQIMNDKKLTDVSGVMIGMAAGVLILSIALKKISDIDSKDLKRSIIGIGAMLAELVGAITLLSKNKGKMNIGMFQMIGIAAAVKILASACKDLSALSWEQLAKGLVGIGAILGELAAFSRFAGEAKHILSTGISMIFIAGAVKLLASAVNSFAKMSWEEIGRGLTAMGIALLEITVAVNLMPTRILAIGPALIAISAALLIMAGALRIMATMSWEQIGKGLVTLGGSMLILAVGVNLMSGALAGAAAMVVVAGALAILTPILLILGHQKLTTIGKGLAAIAGAFLVIGVAGVLLGPLAGTLLKLAGAMALMGLGVTLFGVGLVAAGAGLISIAAGITALGAAIAAQGPIFITGLTMMLEGIIGLVPKLATAVANGLITFVKVIADAAPDLVESFVKIIRALIEALVVCVPELAEGLLKLILSAFDLLAQYAPQIAEKAIEFVGGVLVAIGNALRNVDLTVFTDALIGLGAITAFLTGLSLVSSLLPGAMVGVVELGILIGELAAVFVALGAIKQIPGVEWLIGEGGELGMKIGNAIGKFVGGIVGGIAEGAFSSLPAIGQYLADFMYNAEPFFTGVQSMGSDSFSVIGNLADAILTMTKAELIDGIAGWIAGNSDISSFTESLVDLATGLSEYAAIIDSATFNDEKLEASRNLATMLADFASNEVPKTGGLIGLIMGESDLAGFSEQLKPLADGLVAYADTINASTFNSKKLEASRNLATMLADFTMMKVPKTGGLLSFFSGDNSLLGFVEQLPDVATALASYATNLGDSFDKSTIDTSVGLIHSFLDIGDVDFPKFDQGDLDTFKTQLPELAAGLNAYVTALGNGVITNGSTIIESSEELAEILGALASIEVPSTGGILQWLRGENDLSVFGNQLPILADGLTQFAEKVSGDTALSGKAVDASMNLAKMLSELAKNDIPTTGGIFGFLHQNDINIFANQLPNLASCLTQYAEGLGDALTDGSGKIEQSKTLLDMLSSLSQAQFDISGGILGTLLGGGNDLKRFASQLPVLAEALTNYAANLGAELSSNKVERANTVAEMLISLQQSASGLNNGGLFKAGDLEKFGQNLSAFGEYLVRYCENLTKTSPDVAKEYTDKLVETINHMADANVDAIAQLAEKMGEGAEDIEKTAQTLTNSFATGISEASKTSFTKSASDLVESLKTAIESNGSILETAGATLSTNFKTGLDTSISDLSGKIAEMIGGVATAISDKKGDYNLSGQALGGELANGFNLSTADLSGSMTRMLVTAAIAIVNIKGQYKTSGQVLGGDLAKGITNKEKYVKDAGKKIAKAGADEAEETKKNWESVGKNLAEALARGIKSKESKVTSTAKQVARNAYNAAKNSLQINSPSKLFIGLGQGIDEGLIVGMERMSQNVASAGEDVVDNLIGSTSGPLSTLANILESEFDNELTIRPVLDLSDVRAGSGTIGNLFRQPYSVGVNGRLDAISARMTDHIQGVSNADVVAAIGSLEKTLSDIPRNTYNVNGLTYDDGTNVSNAIRALIRAAKIGGRV